MKRKKILYGALFAAAFYFFDKVSLAVRCSPGADVAGKLLHLGEGFSAAFSSALLSFHATDLLVGAAGAIILLLIILIRKSGAKKFRAGSEYGSARWGTPADIRPFVDKSFLQNVLFTKTERLTMNERPKDPRYARNKNVLVIGGSGSGKTRNYVIPNLLQMHSSYVVTDPKGTIIGEVGTALLKGGYEIKVFNTVNFSKSMHYNPFSYIRSEKDILKFVNVLMLNTKGEGEKAGEDFWVKAERLLYCALVGYIHYEASEEEKNFSTLLELLAASQTKESENYKSKMDFIMEDLRAEDPEHFALRQYEKFKLAAGKTAKSILISCGARLAPFDIKELREITQYDELQMDTLGDKKTALFLIMSDTDTTFNFVLAILQSQLFNLLCDKADDVYGGALPVHVRCILDEFANIGQVPNFDKLIATMRSRRISASIILQTQSQLKTIYKDAADTIIGNCDSMLFLGGRERTTLKEISAMLGKETIDYYNTSESRGASRSSSVSYQKKDKALMSEDEIAVMDGNKCILQLRGVRPFLSEKFDIRQHPRYKYLAEADPENSFDVTKFLAQRTAVPGPEEEFDYFEYKENV